MTQLVMLTLMICVVTSCGTHSDNYERLARTEDVQIEIRDLGLLQIDDLHNFASLEDRSFIDYLNKKVAKRDLAWIVVGKLARMNGLTETEIIAYIHKLQTLGFKRVIVQYAASQEGFDIRHDIQTEQDVSQQGGGHVR
jgi:hypothetical protein